MVPESADEPQFVSHDVEVVSDGPDGHVWQCHTCDVAGWYDAGSDTGAHDDVG